MGGEAQNSMRWRSKKLDQTRRKRANLVGGVLAPYAAAALFGHRCRQFSRSLVRSPANLRPRWTGSDGFEQPVDARRRALAKRVDGKLADRVAVSAATGRGFLMPQLKTTQQPTPRAQRSMGGLGCDVVRVGLLRDVL